jgi:hypothetical protein
MGISVLASKRYARCSGKAYFRLSFTRSDMKTRHLSKKLKCPRDIRLIKAVICVYIFFSYNF